MNDNFSIADSDLYTKTSQNNRDISPTVIWQFKYFDLKMLYCIVFLNGNSGNSINNDIRMSDTLQNLIVTFGNFMTSG